MAWSFLHKHKRKSLSPGQIAWKKFRRNPSASISLLLLILLSLAAVAGYLITPDASPYANTQTLEIAAQKPGFRVNMLRVRKNQEFKQGNLLRKMLYGRNNTHLLVPFQTISLTRDSVIISRYTGYDNIPGQEIGWHIADVLFALDTMTTQASVLQIHTLSGDTLKLSSERLQQQIQQENIIQKTFWLGTDRFGRDMLSQVIIGARVSLSVGFIAIAIALFIGVFLGSLAGFFRGRTDDFILWLINVVWSIPTLLLVIAITFALGKGFWQVFIAVGLTMWVDVARVVRGQIISVRENEYIEAARALGLPNRRIIFRHILPEITGPVVVISAANFASAILIEAGLSFLGIGVQPPMPSWGAMIKENYGFIILDKSFLALIPGICIMLLVMAFMLIGNGLREALDKKAG